MNLLSAMRIDYRLSIQHPHTNYRPRQPFRSEKKYHYYISVIALTLATPTQYSERNKPWQFLKVHAVHYYTKPTWLWQWKINVNYVHRGQNLLSSEISSISMQFSCNHRPQPHWSHSWLVPASSSKMPKHEQLSLLLMVSSMSPRRLLALVLPHLPWAALV